MIIDFNKIELKNMPAFKGGVGSIDANMFFDGTNRIFLARIKKGSSIGYHLHDTGSEIMYVLEGVATVTYNGEVTHATKGEVHYCKKGNSHSVKNEQDDDLLLYCVVCEQ